jgi:hypothetical protein
MLHYAKSDIAKYERAWRSIRGSPRSLSWFRGCALLESVADFLISNMFGGKYFGRLASSLLFVGKLVFSDVIAHKPN